MTALGPMWTPLDELPWKFAGRVTLDDVEMYAWTRTNVWETDWHTIPVHEFWPKPKPAATVRPNSIVDWINRLFFTRPEPGTQQDYTLARGDHHA